MSLTDSDPEIILSKPLVNGLGFSRLDRGRIPDDVNVVWKPHWGSQSLALASPAKETLYHGPRGPGKTDCQIFRFRRNVGVGYGAFWRGVIFDVEYKNLDDIVAKSLKWFPQFNDGAVFLRSAKDYKWVWPTGEELLFRTGSAKEDYNQFHGHEYCLSEGERVRTARGLVAIELLRAGDMALTPVGYRRVNAVFPVGKKGCVKVSSYTSDGHLRFEQRQSAVHRLLTSEGDWKSPGLQKYCKVMRYDGTCDFSESGRKSPHDVYQGIQASCVSQGYAGSDAKSFRSSIQSMREVLSSTWFSLLRSVFLRLDLGRVPRSSIQLHVLSVFSLLFGTRKVGQRMTATSLERLQALVGQEQVHSCVSCHVRSEGAPAVSRKCVDSQFCCLSGRGQCGEPARKDRENGQFSAPLLPYVQGIDLVTPSGDLVGESGGNRRERFVFSHPYEDKQVESVLQLSECEVDCVPCGELNCWDIEIDDVNSYVTESGLVNKNCFIGFNELTKQSNSDFFDAIKSCNRSSFDPSVNSPDPSNPLPPIPLEIFCTTNPHGVGHSWVKRYFIDAGEPGEIVTKEIEILSPETRKKKIVKVTKTHIFGHWIENGKLPDAYIADLMQITDENKRKAWAHGDWNVTAGGALDDVWDHRYVRRPRFKIPPQWKKDRCFDWGSTVPFYVGWFAECDGSEVEIPVGIDGKTVWWGPPKGSLILFNEWYGSTSWTSNVGLRIGPRAVAEGICARERMMREKCWIVGEVKPGPADNQIHNQNDADTDSIAKRMAAMKIKWTESDKSPGSRKNGLEIMRDMLRASVTGDGPGFFIMDNCQAALNILPLLQRDIKDPDDAASDGQDHPWDAIRYRILDRKRTFGGIESRFYGGA